MRLGIYDEMEFHKKLKYHSGQLRLSQQSIADRLEVSQSLVNKWMLGNGKPKLREALGLSRMLGVTIDYLLDESKRCLEDDEVRADREVREIVWRVGPKRVWEILVDNLRNEKAPNQGADIKPVIEAFDIDPISGENPKRRA